MRFGIGWRPELGASILTHLDEIDVIEILAEDFVRANAKERQALRFLRGFVPLVVHATSLGLASPERVSRQRLDAIARLIDWLEPEFWSEHIAFVRAGVVEIGHLAAPPRNDETLEGLVRNVDEARRVVGAAPLLENVATLVDPPLSTYDEAEWFAAIAAAASADLLLDLHNLHANATNFGFDAAAVVDTLDANRIGAVHLAGGRRIEEERILDDHLHDVPDPVYDLLTRVPAPNASVILERDGNYPQFDELLAQLRRARACARTGNGCGCGRLRPHMAGEVARHHTKIHEFLARLYTDDGARTRFIAAPYEEALAAGFGEDDARAVAATDPASLSLAARSFAKKRAVKAHFQNRTS